MRFLLILLATGCGATAHTEPRQCGALPSVSTCQPTEWGQDGCTVLLCRGWPENEFNTPDQYVQQVSVCDGEVHRSVTHVASGHVVCRDER